MSSYLIDYPFAGQSPIVSALSPTALMLKPSNSSPAGYCVARPAIPPNVRTKADVLLAPVLLAEKDGYVRSETG